MKKEIKVGSYKVQYLNNGTHAVSSKFGGGTLVWNKLIKENKLDGKELDIILRVKKEN